MTKSLLGTQQHQQVLQSIVDYYADDARILAILLFGSLSRGNWDVYSDLDLDIVIEDDVHLTAGEELEQLCAGIKTQLGFDSVVIADEEEGDVVLSNLTEFSIRYHPLQTTKPAILDSMMLLAGTLPLDEIRRSDEANRMNNPGDLSVIVSQIIRYNLELRNAIARERLWVCLEFVHRMRLLWMQLFTVSRGGIRTIQYFETNGLPQLQAYLHELVPQPEIASLKHIIPHVCYLLENELDAFSDGKVTLTPAQQSVINQLCESV